MHGHDSHIRARAKRWRAEMIYVAYTDNKPVAVATYRTVEPTTTCESADEQKVQWLPKEVAYEFD